jgi:broad specificity phosphatase PhoE
VLILVRHAMPDATPETPPNRWTLSDEGRRAAALLRDLLPSGAKLVSSTEPKAWETLGGGPAVIQDARFGEIERPREKWSEDFRAIRAQYVAGAVHPGWESHHSAAARFQAGVDEHLEAGRTLVVATHGMAMTVWLVALGALAAADAQMFWRGLRFPDCHAVDIIARSVERVEPSLG